MPQPKRLQSLDVLRFIAVLLVFGAHLPERHSPAASVGEHLYDAWHAGFIGVYLFFVLSGFLVAGLLFDEAKQRGTLDAKRFLIRRGLKIYPAFWGYTAAVCLWLAVSGRAISFPALASELLFVQNYGPRLWAGHTWTLAVEEHFYLSLPFVLLAMQRNQFVAFPRLAIGICIAALISRCINTAVFPYDQIWHVMGTHAAIDCLVFGALLSYWYHFQHSAFVRIATRFRIPLLVLGAFAMSFPAWLDDSPKNLFLCSVGITVLQLGAGAIVAASVVSRTSSNLLISWVAKIGTYSYSIYLWHMAVMAWLMPVIEKAPIWWTPWKFAVVYSALALAVGAAMSLAVEWPVLRLRDRFFPALGGNVAKASHLTALPRASKSHPTAPAAPPAAP